VTMEAKDSAYHAGVEPVADLIEQARQALLMHRVSTEGADPHFLRVPSDAIQDLMQALIARVQRTVEQIVPFRTRSQAGSVFSGLLWHSLAARKEVRRYYLVPSGETTRAEVRAQVAKDGAHHLRSLPVPVTGADAIPAPMNPLWLIDDGLVVRQEPGRGDQGSWLVTSRRTEVTRARRLMRAAESCADAEAPSGPDLTASLLESAEMLRISAKLSCNGTRFIDEHDCSWYHGSWQYLRLFDMVSSPSWHADFYLDRLRAAIGGGARRILISGTADYTTLAFVLMAARDDSGHIPDDLQVHVVDLCRTPLQACRWFADRHQIKIAIHQADITREDESQPPDFRHLEPFDLVVADAFLTRFTHKGAESVLSQWQRLLRPGGGVVTTVRLHPRNEYPDQDAIDPDLAADCRPADPVDNFELRLRERAADWQDMLPIDLEDLSRAGRKYADRMISNDLGDADAIKKTFIEKRFALAEAVAAPVPGELVGTEYLRVVALVPGGRPVLAT